MNTSRFKVCDPQRREFIASTSDLAGACRLAYREAVRNENHIEVFDALAPPFDWQCWRISPSGEVYIGRR